MGNLLAAVVEAFAGFWPAGLPVFLGLIAVVLVVRMVTGR